MAQQLREHAKGPRVQHSLGLLVGASYNVTDGPQCRRLETDREESFKTVEREGGEEEEGRTTYNNRQLSKTKQLHQARNYPSLNHNLNALVSAVRQV